MQQRTLPDGRRAIILDRPTLVVAYELEETKAKMIITADSADEFRRLLHWLEWLPALHALVMDELQEQAPAELLRAIGLEGPGDVGA